MEKGFFQLTYIRVLSALTLLMLVIALGSYATLNFEKTDFINPAPATISVSGEGEVLAVPDIGQFSFSVNATADDAATAQEESGTKINDILTYLTDQGIAEKDIKTQNYNLYPRYRYEERICPAGNAFCPPGERVADGFEVTQTVSVKIRETDTSGQVIAGVGERGATDISGLNFTVDDTDAIKAEARAVAIADAQAKAQVLAEQLGVKIVRLSNYSEGGGYYEPQYNERMMAFDQSAETEEAFDGASMPVGEDKITTQVTLMYEVE
jgi:uncharacterized protein YggE